MKRIAYAGTTLVTSDAVADQLLTFTVELSQAQRGTSVAIPVLESNGTVRDHTLALNPSSQMEITDVDGQVGSEDPSRFPTPSFPILGGLPVGMGADEVEESVPEIDERTSLA